MEEVELQEEDILNPFNSGTSLLFKTKVNVYKHYLSGLLIVKQKGEGKRVVFTSEMGIKFFDFEFEKDTFIVHHCISKLNKDAVLATLEEDIGMAILHNVTPRKYEIVRQQPKLIKYKEDTEKYYYSMEGKKVIKIENTTNNKLKVVVMFKKYNDDVPKEIRVHHYDIKLDIELNYIKR